jgi:hypothetical protein
VVGVGRGGGVRLNSGLADDTGDILGFERSQ